MTSPPRMFARPFYFLRHGETEANASGVISGSLDVELTALGRAQAASAAQALAAAPISGIYASPLRRARDTAEPIASVLRLPVTIIPELTERGRGELEGMAAKGGAAAEQGAESFEDFTARVMRGLSRVESTVPLIVAHLGVFRVLCRTLGTGDAGTPLLNAVPLRVVPLPAGAWTLEPVAPATGHAAPLSTRAFP